jgi:LuxR family transcriptional regulator, activator of conjugal transfer of Ti plasmids
VSAIEHSFQEFVDALQTGAGENDFQQIGERVAHRLGFRWFAYLSLSDDVPRLISSYPRSWTSRYFKLGYQEIDPVLRRARIERQIFNWDGRVEAPRSRRLKGFFDDATTFGIRTGVTVPVSGGFGRLAAFTFASQERSAALDRLVAGSADILHLIGLYFHAHAVIRLSQMSATPQHQRLTQRECQCLAWSARGKSVTEIAIIVGISPRTVIFHLENCRRKLNAASLTHCAVIATRDGLIP